MSKRTALITDEAGHNFTNRYNPEVVAKTFVELSIRVALWDMYRHKKSDIKGQIYDCPHEVGIERDEHKFRGFVFWAQTVTLQFVCH
ncbi:hypothetical protein EGR_02136 [Echinococcus granulosus]|uniref:Uncharacterized protein n=1 Tax=Echinococcus granulosus TaxID=6210 RepID=W6UX08_ECHGR|nr:hypothetical protein EGR_02136 [Echinococcus granulosus]EUB63042.1 hypothetical protein EGR_02136 [Echinococcus granulosus]